MEFTNEVLRKMEEKLKYNVNVSGYFYRLFVETNEKRHFNLSNNVKDCLNFWQWDCYHVNKVMDLQRVNRCKNRFCSNCRKFDLSRALNNLSPCFRKLVLEGYYPYLMTLTVPNVKGDDLQDTLDKMQVSFKRFYKWYSCDDRRGYKDRFVRFDGLIRCLEITYNSKYDTYHPHYHCLVFCLNYDECLFNKYISGEWSNSRQSYNMYSDMDMQVRELWTISYDSKSLRSVGSLDNFYIADIREMDSGGIFEVLKYSFKDTDILNFYVFKNIYYAIYNRRLRQGYGLLHNVKLENDSDGKKQSLEDYIKEKESPEQLFTTDLKTLYNSTYANYIKISRFNKHSKMNEIID